MPSEKSILTAFAHADLQAAVTKLRVEVSDRRRKDALIAGLLKAHAADFAALLGQFAAPALKFACEALDVSPEGRGKAGLVAGLAAVVPAKKVRAKAAKAPAAQSAKPRATKAAKAEPKKTAAKTHSKNAQAAVSEPATKPAAKKPVAQKVGKAPGKKTAQVAQPAASSPQVAPKSIEPAPASAPAQDAPPEAMAAQPAPAKKPASAKRGPLSWSEAAQMAEHRGQSAATMLRAPVAQTTGTTQHTCSKCHKAVTLQACQVQACNNYYVAAPGRKICSECLFERNTISMDDFNDRLHEERQCTHCGVPMTHLSGGNA